MWLIDFVQSHDLSCRTVRVDTPRSHVVRPGRRDVSVTAPLASFISDWIPTALPQYLSSQGLQRSYLPPTRSPVHRESSPGPSAGSADSLSVGAQHYVREKNSKLHLHVLLDELDPRTSSNLPPLAHDLEPSLTTG
jgi:hypothetical protein